MALQADHKYENMVKHQPKSVRSPNDRSEGSCVLTRHALLLSRSSKA
jgi:hypothetical protein